jgi:hypothetical protein
MAKEAVISVASSSFFIRKFARAKKKKRKEFLRKNCYLVGDVRPQDPPTEIVLLFSGDASKSIATRNDMILSLLIETT